MKKLCIQDCVDFAISKNGKCLSIEYSNNTENIIWQCCNNHIWMAIFANIKNGSLERMNRKDGICDRKKIKLMRMREKDWESNKELGLQKIINFIGNE